MWKKVWRAAGAGDARSFFQRRIEIAKRRRQEHDFDADRAAQMRPDDAPEGIDIEHRLSNETNGHERLVEQPVFRIEQKNPTHGFRQRRQKKRQPEKKLQRAFHGNIGARDQPGEKATDQQSDRLSGSAERQSVAHRLEDTRRGERFDPAVKTLDDRLARDGRSENC